MENSFELASNTPISPDALRAADSRRFAGKLFSYYVSNDPSAAPAAVVGKLADVATLEEQVKAIGGSWPHLFTLAHLFRATLRPPQQTDVPGHGTVTDVGIADGSLGVQQNLLVEGTLLVAGDLSVGGQLIVAEGGIVIVTGALHSSAVAAHGQISVGGDLRTMFSEVTGSAHSLDVSGMVDAFLLIQNDHVVRCSTYDVGLHAVYPRANAAAEVFLPAVLGADGNPDWTAIARAAQSGEDVFRLDYDTPPIARGTLVEKL